MDDFLEISCVWERPFSIQKIVLPIFGPCEKLQEMGEGIDRSQSVFYFVPQENSHSQAGSTRKGRVSIQKIYIANFAKRGKRVKCL